MKQFESDWDVLWICLLWVYIIGFGIALVWHDYSWTESPCEHSIWADEILSWYGK